jgi:signal transduction histidine kinase/CheY-like chemotaxis protein
MRFFCRVAGSCLLLLGLTAGSGKAQLFAPKLLRQFTGKSGLNLTASDIVQDARGWQWIASANGIVRFDGRQFRVFHDPVLKEGDFYYHLTPSPDGRIWLKMGSGYSLSYVDTRQQRLVRVADTTRLVRHYLAKYGSHSLFADAEATLWIGLQANGLLKVNSRTLAVEHVVNQGLDVRFITQDHRGIIYFTTANNGFFVYNPKTRKLTNYQHHAQDATSVSSNATFGVQARPDGSILVGLVNGADVFWPATGQFQHLGLNIPPTADPLNQSYIKEFGLDAQGNAYFSTGETNFRYTAQGVLQQLEVDSPTHSITSLYVSPTNRLWVSSTDKLYEYDLNQARLASSLLLLRLTINGSELLDNTSATRNLVYDTQGHPTLTVREDDPFAMQFTLSARQGPGTLRWRLNGYNQDWIVWQRLTGEAAYQLPAGTYTFTVNRGKLAGGWEPTVSTLTIVVVAPFWKSPPFLALIGLVVGALGYYFIRTYRRRRQLARQLASQQAEAANLRQLDELKTRFFSNVTHEFRTPLTIILNATEQWRARNPAPEALPEVTLIQRHAHQLLRLITETLDMARLDAGKLETHPQVGNPRWFIEQVVDQFAGLAAQRGVTLTYHTPPTAQPGSAADSSPNASTSGEGLFGFDGEKWEKIIYNLLANALKFTPSGGRVQVTSEITADHQFLLSVRDTGIGIPADQLARIFERFHQVDASSTRAYSGTGIGLALVRELTSWLGGQVRVESQLGQGSTFTVYLPLTLVPEAPNGLPPVAVPINPATRPTPPYVALSGEVASEAMTADKSDVKPIVLVVEDQDDLRTQVVDHLSDSYQVLSASNGRLGWEQALLQVPDVIVSDVMMPELDGIALLERLKTDERTSHIPVILLTARSSIESRLAGLQRGADDYLVKPFSLAELALRIRNGLRTRQQGQRRFLALFTAGTFREMVSSGALDRPLPGEKPPVAGGEDREEAFLNRLRQAVLAQLPSAPLDVDWLASQAGMSRTQLNRKLSALTNLSPNRFIQRIRLERGSELLATGTLTVAEVAYQIGYQSPSHFAKVFQEHFGYPPGKLKG